MKKLFTLLLTAIVLSCCSNNTYELPDAEFGYIENGLQIEFRNYSKNAHSYLWLFGDGTKSTEYEPIHKYEKKGRYTVRLKATNNIDNTTDSAEDIIYIE